MDLRLLGWARVAVLSCALAGCALDNAPTMERDGDPVLFEAEVQPILGARCAFEGCHGREGMPLALYAVDFLRLRDPEGNINPDLPPLDERALSTAELEHNRRALAARTSASDPLGDELILRLLSVDEGGIPHGDVVVYLDPANAELAVLRRFLEGAHATR